MSMNKAFEDFKKELPNTVVKLTMAVRLPAYSNRGYFSSSKDTPFVIEDIDDLISIPIHSESLGFMELDTKDTYKPKFDHPSFQNIEGEYSLRQDDPRTIIKMKNGNEFLVVEDRDAIETKIYAAVTRSALDLIESSVKKIVKFEI